MKKLRHNIWWSWELHSYSFIPWSMLYACMFIKKFFLMFIFEREKESACTCASGGGAERERKTQTPKQAPGSEPSAQSPTQGSNSQTMRSWPEPKPDAQPTEPPGTPYACTFVTAIHEHPVKTKVIKLWFVVGFFFTVTLYRSYLALYAKVMSDLNIKTLRKTYQPCKRLHVPHCLS